MYYNIFAGTNSFSEVLTTLKYLLCFRFKDQRILDSFHKAVQENTHTKYAYSFGSGRMSLYVILKALGIQTGDEIIIPAYTCVVVANAILYAGAKPVYVDIDPITFNIDVSKIDAAITPNTKAILAQHTFGLICDIDSIKSIAKKHRIKVIEDSVHALGVSHNGAKVGSLADIAYFSCDNSKIISSFCGGFVATNDPELGNKLKQIWESTNWLRTLDYFRIGISFILAYLLYYPRIYRWSRYLLRALGKFRVMFYYRDELKLERPALYPARMSSLQAAIALSQLKSLDQNIMHRQSIGLEAERCVRYLGKHLETNASNHSFLRYSFLAENRETFLRNMSPDYDLGIWFTSVLHGRTHELEKLFYRKGSCPVAENVAKRIVNIPTHLRIPKEDVISSMMAHHV